MISLKRREYESVNVKNCRAKIVYPGIEAEKKYCLCRDWSPEEIFSMKTFKDCLKIAWSGKQTQYSQPQDLIDLNKKKFLLSAAELHDECSVSISVEIIRFEHLQRVSSENSTLWYFCRSTCNQMHYRLQPRWFFGRWSLYSVLQVATSHPHITTCQVLP